MLKTWKNPLRIEKSYCLKSVDLMSRNGLLLALGSPAPTD